MPVRATYLRYMEDGRTIIRADDGLSYAVTLVAYTNISNPLGDEVKPGDTIELGDYVPMERVCWNCGGSGIRCCEFGSNA